MAERQTLTVAEAAEILGVSPDTLYRAHRRGDAPVRILRVGGRLLVSRRDLERLLDDDLAGDLPQLEEQTG